MHCNSPGDLVTGVYDQEIALKAIRQGTVDGAMVGAPLSAAAFSVVLGQGGKVLVAVCLILFAFSSLLGWSYYGEQGLRYLTGGRGVTAYRFLFLIVTAVGSVSNVTAVWLLADIFNALMAAPNLLAILLLLPKAVELWRCRVQKEG